MSNLKPVNILAAPDGILNLINGLLGGIVKEELDTELAKGVGGVLELGGKSEITLKLKVGRVAGSSQNVVIDYDVIAKHPKEDRQSKIMFVSTGNGVLENPEKQESLGLGEEIDNDGRPALQAVEPKASSL